MNPRTPDPTTAALRPAGVLCCGNTCFDTLVRPVEELRWNASVWVDSIESSPGGNGANTSTAIAKLGVPVRLLSAVGTDEFAERVLECLGRAGVDRSLIRAIPGATSTTVVLIRGNGERTFLHHPGVTAEAFDEPPDLGSGIAAGCGYFHLANAFALPRLRAHAGETMRRARAAGLVTAMDTGWDSRGRWLEDLGPALPYTDYLFVNEREALKLAGCDSWEQAAARLRDLGASVVALKRGEHGCAIVDAAGRLDVPAYDVPAIDSTGAGDCFAGAFLAALSRGLPAASAAQVANAAGALNVRSIGATAGLLSWDEMIAWMQTAPVRRV
ncbi:MAG: carbohydrate kinase family protein [bacterium]